MVTEGKLANAVGGKTARACDNCIRKRARWYCASDDAFLCQGCDASVHSANPLARRHERVLLKTASSSSSKPSKEESSLEASLPPWHNGFVKKARTPRQNKLQKAKFEEITRNPLHLVPEFSNDETSYEENEEQLLYRVPVFDPFIAELCTSSNSNEAVNTNNNDVEITDDDAAGNDDESKSMSLLYDHSGHDMNHQLHGSLPSELDLAQFAADVESLLGTGLDDESFNMEALGLMDCQEHDLMMSDGKVKVEDDDEEEAKIVMAHQEFDVEIDVSREPFELNFDDNSLNTCEEHGKSHIIIKESEEDYDVKNDGKKVLLGLDYDGVITSWADQRSPWTNGERPQFDSYECWPYCMGTCGKVHEQYYGDVPIMGQHPPTMVDEGREARVSRYREKRRTRLFSKKIRYEVRKLNAEKRPRMKGRFVKRTNFAAPATTAFP